MAFIPTDLTRAGGGVQQIHCYKSADAIATITASGYFNSVTGQLRQYDIIHVVSSTGGTPTFDSVFVTSATGAAVVTTSAVEGVTAT